MGVSARRVALVALLATTLFGCLDRSDHYSNLGEAREGLVFEKGWLPDILPASAYDIKVITTVEDAAGRGTFLFDQKDYLDFMAKLSAYDGSLTKVDPDNETIRELLAAGYEARKYESSRGEWIFLCDSNEARCNFFVW